MSDRESREMDDLVGADKETIVEENGAWNDIMDRDDWEGRDPVDIDFPDPFQVREQDDYPGLAPAREAVQRFDESSGVVVDENGLADSFHEQVAQEQQAEVGASSDLEQIAKARDVRHAQDRSIAPYVRTLPPSFFRALVGGQASVDPSQAPQQVVFWAGDDVESSAMTVMLFPLDSTPVVGGPVGLRKFAKISFGSRDGRADIEVDIGTGCQFTVPASSLYVFVGLDPGSLPVTFRLAASIGGYAIVRTSQITRTKYLDTQATGAGGAVTFNRPAYAASLYGFERADVAAAYLVEFLDSQGIVIYTRLLGANLYWPPGGVPLSDDVTQIKITNNGMNPGNARAIFGLAL